MPDLTTPPKARATQGEARVSPSRSPEAHPTAGGVLSEAEMRELIKFCDAMVQTALETLRDARTDEALRDVLCWMAASANAKAPCSFEFCCRAAGLQAAEIRKFVARSFAGLINRFTGPEHTAQAKPTPLH
ncbi:MAG: hypothetical protein ACYCT1_14440 [Steroidobacteraceae bacterium]